MVVQQRQELCSERKVVRRDHRNGRILLTGQIVVELRLVLTAAGILWAYS